ncbi:hypothetical protein BpHYR1_004338 [Brachionus plicatilis]|uniref:Uncharacterized protein n=1 Tax=Brachionus plicatilis TaxID=10195 RepID=A0A3M7RZZ2_BRAPC|nr:hypothetical protein BpHYR1_004338 [Brachionus plicatilis]
MEIQQGPRRPESAGEGFEEKIDYFSLQNNFDSNLIQSDILKCLNSLLKSNFKHKKALLNTFFYQQIEIQVIDQLTSDLFFKQTSFSPFSKAFNILYPKSNMERNKLIEHRITESWFYHMFLQFLQNEMKLNLEKFESPVI